jgi:hypothetical protein
MSSEKYMQQAVANVETELEKVDQCLPMRDDSIITGL